MTLGPFLIREFRISSRRGRIFLGRATSAGVVLAVIGCMGLAWTQAGWERGSVRGMAGFTLQVFAAIVVLQALGAWVGVPGEVAPRIAGERERRTLDALLASRLSSAEIVLGTTAEGVTRYLTGLTVLFPIVLLMVPLGGIDPRLVLLAFAGLLSMTFFLAALSAMLSAGARDRRVALSWSIGLAGAWMTGPLLALILLPKLWPVGALWAAPLAIFGLESSPVGVLTNVSGLVRGGGWVGAILRMIGLQVAGGVLFLLWAVVRLRPASRAAHDGEGRTLRLLGTSRSRRKPWPACGDDPVFWRETHSQPAATRFQHLLGALLVLFLIGCLGAGTYWFARPAFEEVLAHGYGLAAGRAEIPEVSPLALAIPRGWSGGVPTGQARVEFNAVIRQFTVFWDMLYVLNLAGFAAAGIARERDKDTWSGLLATPLTGREIVRAKMRAAAWKMRGAAAVLLVLWTVGLVAGAVHPLGYAGAIAGLGISTWFLVGLGTYVSLRSPDATRAINRTFTVVGLLVFSALLPVILVRRAWDASVLMGAASAPMHAGLSLLSYEDVREAFGSGGFPSLGVMGLNTGEGAWAVLAACLIGLVGQAIGAALLTRAAIRDFDEVVGRPSRPPGGHDPRARRDAGGPMPARLACKPPMARR